MTKKPKIDYASALAADTLANLRGQMKRTGVCPVCDRRKPRYT